MGRPIGRDRDGHLSVAGCRRCERPILVGDYVGTPVRLDRWGISWSHAEVLQHYGGLQTFALLKGVFNWIITEAGPEHRLHAVEHRCSSRHARGDKL